MTKNYKYTVIDISEEGEVGFKAVIPKFPKVHVVADSPKELHEAVNAAIEEEIKFYKKKGVPVPKPDMNKYSGKFVLRIEPEIHEMLAELSSAEGETLNQYVKSLIKEKVC